MTIARTAIPELQTRAAEEHSFDQWIDQSQWALLAVMPAFSQTVRPSSHEERLIYNIYMRRFKDLPRHARAGSLNIQEIDRVRRNVVLESIALFESTDISTCLVLGPLMPTWTLDADMSTCLVIIMPTDTSNFS